MPHTVRARGTAAAVAVLLALPLAGCEAIADATSPRVTAQEYIFHFDRTISGWTTNGVNVDAGGADWSIAASAAHRAGGSRSVAFHMANRQEDARIWMERTFGLQANATYEIEMRFEFASADWGPGEHWDLLVAAGAGELDPGVDAFHTSSTANGATVDDGFRWRTVRLPTRVRTGDDGQARIAIGIAGATLRDATYYLDELGVKFSRK